MKLEPITSEKEWKVIETALRVLQDELKGKDDEKNKNFKIINIVLGIIFVLLLVLIAICIYF